jgi:hypothetical protein
LHKPKPTCERGDERVEPIGLRRAHAMDEEHVQRPPPARLIGKRRHALKGPGPGVVIGEHDGSRKGGAGRQE